MYRLGAIVRRSLLSHPRRYGLLIGGLALFGLLWSHRQQNAIDRAENAWGATATVWVAARPLDTGATLTAADVRRQAVPRGVRPVGALTSTPTGAVLTAPVGAGEILTDRRVEPAGLGAVAALVGAGRRAVAVPRGNGPVPVAVGDRVDVVAAGEVVAASGTVVAVGDAAVTVAVPSALAATVADHALRGEAALALAGRTR